MARVFGVLLAALYLASSASAIPVESRQLGGIGCNVARLKTVAGLRQATTAVNKIAGSSDPAAASAAATAQGGLQDASAGIKTIAGALLTGQAAPAAARDQVGQGLTTADTALGNITSTDSTVTSMVADARTKVQNTISAGQDVVSQCGGGGGDAGAAAAAGTGANAGSGAAANDGTSSGTDASDATANNGNNGTDGSDVTADNGTNTGTGSSDATGSNDGTDGSSASDTTDINGANSGTDSSDVTGNSGSDSGSDGSGAVGSNAGAVDSSSDNTDGVIGTKTPTNLRNSRIFGKRQIGGIGCNVARAQTVGRLAQSAAAVKAVKSAAASDATSAAAADQATTALNSAKAGIAKIAVALITGQKAPAAARDQVQAGLTDAMTALTGINSTDPNVTSAVTAAQSKVSSTTQAGQDVVSKC